MRRLLTMVTMVTMVTAASSALLTGASAAAAGGLAAGGSGAFGLSAAAAGGAWGKAREIPGTAAISTTHPILNAVVDSVSCASAGNCGAGGTYEDRFGEFAFVVSQVNGTWGKAQKVRGTIILKNGNDAELSSVSCASAGNCGAGGFYRDSAAIDQAWVVSEKNGTWGKAEEVPGTAALNVARGNGGVNSVSCASAGNCSAGGIYTNAAQQNQAFVVSEKNGTWGKAEPVPGLVSSDAGVDSVSCASAGNCSAGGFGSHQTSRRNGVFVVSQKNGIWGHAQNINGLGNTGASIASVSCGSAGNCGAGGGVGGIAGEAFVVSEKAGIVGAAQAVPGLAALGGDGAITSMSCASASDCIAGGYYVGTGMQAFVVSEKNGTWGKAEEIPGTAALNRGGNAEVTSVSCGSTGNCIAGGAYLTINRHDQAFVVSEKDGIWGNAEEVPGTAALNKGKSAQVNSVSCASAGNCSAGGYYLSRKFNFCHGAFVVSEKKGTWGKAEQVPGTVREKGCTLPG